MAMSLGSSIRGSYTPAVRDPGPTYATGYTSALITSPETTYASDNIEMRSGEQAYKSELLAYPTRYHSTGTSQYDRHDKGFYDKKQKKKAKRDAKKTLKTKKRGALE